VNKEIKGEEGRKGEGKWRGRETRPPVELFGYATGW